jgi:hypothetical protein
MNVHTPIAIRFFRRLAAGSVLALVSLGVACSEDAGDAVDADEAAIIGGQRDTTHPAVVSLHMAHADGTGGLCTGTIVKVDAEKHIGYVLTAAHCVRDATRVTVIRGDDFKAPGVVYYDVLDFKANPAYTGQTSSPFDVAMVRILGVDATTPVIPIRSPDGLAQGTAVTSIGFGRVVRPSSSSSTTPQNTKRNRIDGAISRISSSQITMRYTGGTTCFGDSGGPVITKVGGSEFVVGVHSYVLGSCQGGDTSGRPTASANFIQSILNLPEPAASCAACKRNVGTGDMACGVQWRACLADADCGGYRACRARCASADAGAGADAGTAECSAACRAQFPLGVGPYTNALNCACGQCADSCTGDASCANHPACGFTMGASTPDACKACVESKCCDEGRACSADAACFQCATTSPAPTSCETNALRTAMKSCRAEKCAAECPVPAPTGDAGVSE